MKNRLVVTGVDRRESDISCRCSVEGYPAWLKCFCSKEFALRLHYSQPIADAPPGIAVIPLITDVLPIAWVFDAQIEVDELDEAFLNSIPEFKRGYIDMYPKIEFKGSVSVRSAVAHAHPAEKSALFYSGGVDSTDTLIAHLAEKPALITLWGADIAWDNEAGWQPVKRLAEETAARFGLQHYFVRSNFRKIVNEYFLTKYVSAIYSALDWWAGLQHGIAIHGHAAPLAFQYGIGRVYIASSCSSADVVQMPYASVPSIDNFVRFGSSAIVYDAFEFHRQRKIRNICEFVAREGIDIPLRVCYQSTGGKNCCACGKCRQTMLGILAEGGDPGRMGFEGYGDAMRRDVLRHMNWEFLEFYRRRMPPIQAHLRERYTLETCPPDLRRFYRLRLDKGMPKPLKLYYSCKKKLLLQRQRLLRAVKRRIRRMTRAKRSENRA